MAIDLTNLTQSELLQVMNATPLGMVLTRSRLRRQMDAGGLRFGDGVHIHLVRYIRYLVGLLEKPQPAKLDYIESRRRKAERERAATKFTQDIGPISDVEDYARREACGASFRLFCETYFHAAFHRTWSEDHLRVIASIEKAVREGGLFAFAMPRGSGKTSLARCAALWAILYGYRPFVCLIGAADDRAKELLIPIKKHIMENLLLVADFPEAVHPLRALENSSKRQLQQHCRGRLTHVHWGQNKLVFPTIEGEDIPPALGEKGLQFSPSCGSIITTTSLDSNMRGQQHTRADGSIIRPSLVLLDDPQTRESASSVNQTIKRMELLNGDVLGMAGPGEQLAALMTCTIIKAGDMADRILDRDKHPDWNGVRTKMVYAWPSNEKLWDEYARLRADGLRANNGGAPATEFYRAHRAAMDVGAQVAWPARYRSDELSAIQNAVNLKLRDEAVFYSEYQNEPMVEHADAAIVTADQVAAKISGYAQGVFPTNCNTLTLYEDVHADLIYWMVTAWEDNFTGYIIEYGTHPEQGRQYFTKRQATRTLARMHQGAGEDGAIFAGLAALNADLLNRQWRREDGAMLKINMALVDERYKTQLVHKFISQQPCGYLFPSMGLSMKATSQPFHSRPNKPGERGGDHCRMIPIPGRAKGRHFVIDTNHWKTFVQHRLAAAQGDPGCLSIYGRRRADGQPATPGEHWLLAEHLTAEVHHVVIGPYGPVDVWENPASQPDNHWFDCLVGCAVLASWLGATTLPGVPDRAAPRRVRMSVAAMQARARAAPHKSWAQVAEEKRNSREGG